jgi:hypothetical protein
VFFGDGFRLTIHECLLVKNTNKGGGGFFEVFFSQWFSIEPSMMFVGEERQQRRFLIRQTVYPLASLLYL